MLFWIVRFLIKFDLIHFINLSFKFYYSEKFLHKILISSNLKLKSVNWTRPLKLDNHIYNFNQYKYDDLTVQHYTSVKFFFFYPMIEKRIIEVISFCCDKNIGLRYIKIRSCLFWMEHVSSSWILERYNRDSRGHCLV